jgi:hypothetical protein
MSQKTVLAVYDSRSQARQAIEALTAQGFTREEVSLLSGGKGEEELHNLEHPEEHNAGTGATTGGVLGGLGGLLLGLGFLTVPGVGPAVVAGPIASALVGVVVGGVMGGLVGVLMEFGVPETDAHLYSEAIRRGSTVVAVTAPPERVDTVAEALEAHGAVDLAERSAGWKSEGWAEFDPKAEPYSHPVLAARPPLPTSTPGL